MNDNRHYDDRNFRSSVETKNHFNIPAAKFRFKFPYSAVNGIRGPVGILHGGTTMAEFWSLATAGLTAKQVKIVCADRDDGETRKATVRRKREAVQSRFAAVLALKAERAANFAVRREAEWSRRAAKCHVHDEQIKLRLANIRDFDYQRKLHFIATFRDRDRARAVKAEQSKRAKLAAKRENQVSRYRKIVDLQKTARAANEACLMNKSGKTAITAKPIKSVVQEKVIAEPKSLDQCSYTMKHDPVKTDETAHEVYYYDKVFFSVDNFSI